MAGEADHYMKIWDLSERLKLTRTPTSHIYTVMAGGEPAVLKVFTRLGTKDEKASAVALLHFNDQGSVRLLRFDHRAQLLEYADGGDLRVMVQSGRDAEATGIIGG